MFLGSSCARVTNDFSVWVNNAPVLSFGGDWDFSVWLNGAPVLTQDEAGPITSLAGSGFAGASGAGFPAQFQAISGSGNAAATSGTVVNGTGNLAGAGRGAVSGVVSIFGMGGLAGAGLATCSGTGICSGSAPPPSVVIHYRVSPTQPVLRHFDPATDKWWSRRISPRSERQRVPG